MSKEIRTLKKLSIKSVMGLDREADTKAYMTEKAKTSPDIVAFAGDVTGTRVLNGQYGKSIALVGTFVGKNLETGEVFKGGSLFLPKDAAENIAAEFEARKDTTGYVNFSCVIKAVPEKAQGFMYITSPVRDATAVTREAELLATFAVIPVSKQIAAQPVKK